MTILKNPAFIGTLVLIVLTTSYSQAQFQSTPYEVGIQVGTLVYQGDLVTPNVGNLKSLHPSIGINVSKGLDPYFSLRANFLRGKLSANEADFATPAYRRQRNFSFSSSVTEFSGLLVFNPFGQNGRKISPYIFAGAGLTFLNVKRDWSKVDTTVFDNKSAVAMGLAKDTLTNPPRVIAALPVGAGIRYNISPQFSLNFEGMFRFIATDYLDGFKYAANPKNNDRYYGLSVGLHYQIGGYKCPVAK